MGLSGGSGRVCEGISTLRGVGRHSKTFCQVTVGGGERRSLGSVIGGGVGRRRSGSSSS
jgi:hypothetical protein